jgi:hypothetical protein
MGRKTQIRVDGNPIDVTDEDFEIVREDWNEYKLLDGGVVRVKVTVQRIFRALDAQGKPKVNTDGDPEIIVRHSTQIVGID